MISYKLTRRQNDVKKSLFVGRYRQDIGLIGEEYSACFMGDKYL